MTGGTGDRLRHDALFFASDQELVAAVVPFLLDGVSAGEPVGIACSDRASRLLAAEIPPSARIRVFNPEDVYRRPAAATSTWQPFIRDELAAGARHVRVIGEVDFGNEPVEWGQWADYEAAISLPLAGSPAWHLCLYDTRHLPPEVLEVGRLTHPHLLMGTTRVPNPRHVDPVEYLRSDHHGPDPLEATPPTLTVDHLRDADGVAGVRRAVRFAVDRIAPGSTSGEDFTIAVNEIVTNALRHGRPPIRLRLWATPRRSLCTVADGGYGIDDPLAGYGPAPADVSRGGMGLWLARQLCDRVQLSTTAAGFTARLAIRH
jgi:anti-sigma regulatory factor (Ser/Thr protein kinase)